MSREAAIDLRDVFRIYQTGEGDAAALQGLTLRVEPGEHVAVLGPSGSGKSTLLRILAALEAPSAGSARVLGRDIGRLSGRQAAELRASELGLVDQHYDRALPPDLPALETIALQLALRGAPRAERERRARELLERVGLASAAEARPGELSGGEQQRVALCAAIAHRPRLLLADEPAGELDEASVVVIYDLIGELARETGTTVVLVSHDAAAASRADRALRIRDGRLSGERAPRLGGDEAMVVGYGGWVRLPDELLRDAGITSHARASLGPQGIVVRSAAPPAAPERRSARATARGPAARPRGHRGGAARRRPRLRPRAPRPRRPRGVRRAARARSADGRHRTLGLRQEHAAAPPGRARAPGCRRRRRTRPLALERSTDPRWPRFGGSTSRWSARIRDWSASRARPRTWRSA